MPVNKSRNATGKIISVQGPVVDVKFETPEDVPSIFGVIKTKTIDGETVVLEVAEHMPGNIARCIAATKAIACPEVIVLTVNIPRSIFPFRLSRQSVAVGAKVITPV